ncbi:MAG: S49 family peptidase [Actinobacteria bacterium]|nr:S49 family peptidase [Actinomycetota bacterium]
MSDQNPTQPSTPTPPTGPRPTPPPYGYPAPYHPVAQYPVAPAAPAPSQPAKGGFGRGFGIGSGVGIGLGATLVIGMVISSLLFGLLAGNAGAAAATPGVQTIWGSAYASRTVHAFSIAGPILAGASDGSTLSGGTYGYEIAAAIDSLGDETDGLMLILNTPGGSINGSKAIADAVARYQERTGKKVVAFVEGMSASGGMYAMAGADEIIADHGSLIGSIGVIFGPLSRFKDVTAITGTILEPGVVTTGGITQEYLTMGRGKDFGNPFRDMTEEEREVFTGVIQNLYDDFVGWVAKARGLEASFITDTLGAHVFDPKTAVAHGLIDVELGVMDAYRHAAETMGLDPDDTRIVTDAPPGLIDQLLGMEARVRGHALPESVELGQRASASICGYSPAVLAYHGDIASVCTAGR